MDSNYLTGSYIKSKVKTGDPKAVSYTHLFRCASIRWCYAGSEICGSIGGYGTKNQ